MGLISVAFQPSKDRFIVTGRGGLVVSDITDVAAQVYGDPDFSPRDEHDAGFEGGASRG